jgi:hypothetical protein
MCIATKRFPEIIDDDLHQTIFFSLGNLAYRNSKLEKDKLDLIIQQMEEYCQKNPENDDNHEVYDNIHSSIFKIFVIHFNKYP